MPDEFRSVSVADAWDEGPRLRALALDFTGTLGAAYSVPGQYVRARLSGDAKDAFLALASAPGGDRAELLVQRTGKPDAPADRVAALAKGASLEITPPAGKGFSVQTETGRDLLLIAGGSGISAIRSIVEYVSARRGEYGRTLLLMGARTDEDLAYRSRWGVWRAARIEVEPTLSRSASGWTGRTGYVTAALPELALDAAKTSVFLAGGKEMVAASVAAATALGIPAARIFKNF